MAKKKKKTRAKKGLVFILYEGKRRRIHVFWPPKFPSKKSEKKPHKFVTLTFWRIRRV
jgi:hypothetical protein